ncbi:MULTISPECIES: tetratricopeptide repeat protein [Pseudanabaena]|uniref:Forkhead-associated protein n=2 Tax=Pseudanabaena TaxID=1152 RepID=L8MU19_9CYAN|nr:MULTISPECIES: tetratricopeptide repeat protein [Pseudanabaena]ELS31462.1 Forkhead-associated protein [Pseudanabaena biceps PCC 7429]MDG3496272.1 tetratricopeptide repeat protein [Pseudanabaena catenata USMAC16]
MTHGSINPQDATVVDGSQLEHYLILQDPEGQQRILLDSKSYVLGRSPENEIVLRSHSVSREHATLTGIYVSEPILQIFRLTDGTPEKGKSTNGLIINGELRDSWVLMQGDEIDFSSNTSAVYRIEPFSPYANGKINIFLDCLHNLAEKERKSGKYNEAEQYLEQILIINQQLHGELHPYVANCLIDLAVVNYSQNLFQKTEKLLLQAINIRKKILNPEHPDVASLMLDLAAIYNTQALYVKAGLIFLEALAIKEKLLGADNPEIAGNLVDLAAIYYSQKRYKDVRNLYKKAIKIYKRSFDSQHPSILSVQKKLASINKRLRPKWQSFNVLIPLSLILLSIVIAYSFFAPKTDITCVKILSDGSAKSISGDECRQMIK